MAHAKRFSIFGLAEEWVVNAEARGLGDHAEFYENL
jgi:hypothetical protein